MKQTAYSLMVAAAFMAILFAWVLRSLSGTAIYDTNFELFQKLTEVERGGIFHTVAQLMTFQVLLLVLTNLLWAVGVGLFIFRRRRKPEVE